jgi:dihydroorotase
MHASGAVAFSDGLHPVQNSQLLLKALQYVKAFDGIVIQVPDENNLSRTGLVNEGIISTQLGLPGKPALAETLMLARDIELLRYTGSKLHVTGISTAASLELIRRAKSDGLQITCSVAPYHLWFSDEDLVEYDTNLKVNPPLRTPADVAALRVAVLDGTVDCIASHHQPHEWDSKVCEFEYAKYGMEGLESCFVATATALPDVSAERLTALFSINPANIFGLKQPNIAAGEKANITLYQKNVSRTFENKDIFSASKNNAFVGKIFNTVIFRTFC